MGRVATYHFASTPLSRQNLLSERLKAEYIVVTSSTIIDALRMETDKVKGKAVLWRRLKKSFRIGSYDISQLKDGHRMVLITGFQHENLGFFDMLSGENASQKVPRCGFRLPDAPEPKCAVT